MSFPVASRLGDPGMGTRPDVTVRSEGSHRVLLLCWINGQTDGCMLEPKF